MTTQPQLSLKNFLNKFVGVKTRIGVKTNIVYGVLKAYNSTFIVIRDQDNKLRYIPRYIAESINNGFSRLNLRGRFPLENF